MKNLNQMKNLIVAAVATSALFMGCGEVNETAEGQFGASQQALAFSNNNAFNGVYGDLNGDDEINVLDGQCLALTIHAVAGDTDMPDCLSSKKAADLNCDGEINVTDYNIVIYKALSDEPLDLIIDANQNGIHDTCEAAPVAGGNGEDEPDHHCGGGDEVPEPGPATECCPQGSVNFSLEVTATTDVERNHSVFELGYADEDEARVVVVVRSLTRADRVTQLKELIYDRLQCPNAPRYMGKHTWAKQALIDEITHGLAAFESTCGDRLGRGIINILFGPYASKEDDGASPATCIDKQLNSVVKREVTDVNMNRRYLQVRRGAKSKSQHLSALVSFPHLIGAEGCEERNDCVPGQVSPTARIESATLAMYAKQGTPGYGDQDRFEAHLINGEIDPATTLWGDVRRDAPADVTELLDNRSTEGKYTNFDITAGVEQWQEIPGSNQGILLDTSVGYNAYHSCTPHNWLNPSVLRGHQLPVVIVRYAD